MGRYSPGICVDPVRCRVCLLFIVLDVSVHCWLGAGVGSEQAAMKYFSCVYVRVCRCIYATRAVMHMRIDIGVYAMHMCVAIITLAASLPQLFLHLRTLSSLAT